MAHTNAQVAAAFIRGEEAQSGNMKSDGRILWSYETPIAYRQGDGAIRVSSQHHSVTTTRHHAELWSAAYAAGYEGTPAWQGNPDPKRAGRKQGDPEPETVPFHRQETVSYTDSNGIPRSYVRTEPPARAKSGSYSYGQPRNQSDPDARAVLWEFSPTVYEERADNREWYESRNHTSVSKEEPAPTT